MTFPALAKRLPWLNRSLIEQFLRFGVVGCIGFVADNAVIYGTRAEIGTYAAGALAFPVAASVNWLLNRMWTFRGLNSGSMKMQWLKFMATNALGFVLNRGSFFALITISTVCLDNPVIATAAGTAAGMFVNFALSRRLVFK